MRFKEKDIPTRFNMTHYEGDSALLGSADPNVRRLNDANYISEEHHEESVKVLP